MVGSVIQISNEIKLLKWKIIWLHIKYQVNLNIYEYVFIQMEYKNQ